MYKRICITNRQLVKGDFLEKLEEVLGASHPSHPLWCDMLILREKDLPEEQYAILAKRVLHLCKIYEKKCILHSFVDTATSLSHPHIHLTFSDFCALSDAERAFFETIGVSTHSVDEARFAEEHGATYITASHIFPTACKENLTPRGLSFLSEVVNAVHIDVYALGGIHPHNIAPCIAAGAAGVCMMSEYMRGDYVCTNKDVLPSIRIWDNSF